MSTRPYFSFSASSPVGLYIALKKTVESYEGYLDDFAKEQAKDNLSAAYWLTRNGTDFIRQGVYATEAVRLLAATGGNPYFLKSHKEFREMASLPAPPEAIGWMITVFHEAERGMLSSGGFSTSDSSNIADAAKIMFYAEVYRALPLSVKVEAQTKAFERQEREYHERQLARLEAEAASRKEAEAREAAKKAERRARRAARKEL